MNELALEGNIKAFMDAINELKSMNEEDFSDELMEPLVDHLEASFSSDLKMNAINQVIQNLEAGNSTRKDAADAIQILKDTINTGVYGDGLITGNKRKIIDLVVANVYDIFDQILDKYHRYAIELPIKLDDGAQVPTYAHDSDAAADLYALEDVEIPANYASMAIKTGVHIQLPEGWVAMVLPRSSMGMKTSLRLSNSMGVIDSGYRGEVMVIYDNVGNEPYQIHKGDRVAQMYVMPSYRFKAQVVDFLEDSDRGEGGLGSTGV